MKYYYVLTLCLLPIHPSLPAHTQPKNDSSDFIQLYKSVADEYGLDQVLVNGISYEDKYWKKVGNQYFPEDRLYKGTLIYREKEYHGVRMKYDICDQQLILHIYQNYLTVRVVLSNDFVSAFSLDEKLFSKYDFTGKPRFYQVVFDTSRLKCLYYWYKQVQETGNGEIFGYYRFEFTESERKNYLKIDGSYETYKNNRSFTELFPEEIRPMIREYVKTHHIKVNKSSDKEITELLTYCNSLLQTI
jgi:hypothetical protein